MKNIKKYVGLLAGTLAVTTVAYGGRGGKSEEKSSQENKKHIEKRPRVLEANSHKTIANNWFGVTPASFTPSTAHLKLTLPVDTQKNLLPNLRTGQVMHDKNKHYIMMPRLPETNTMSVFRPTPEHQRYLYSVISTNNQNVSTPNSTKLELKKTITPLATNTQAGVRHSTKPQNTLSPTKVFRLPDIGKTEPCETVGRSFLKKEDFTISENRHSTLIGFMKKYVAEPKAAKLVEVWNILMSELLAKTSGFLKRPIIYFTHDLVILFANNSQIISTTNLQAGRDYLNEHPDALIVLEELYDVFFIVTSPIQSNNSPIHFSYWTKEVNPVYSRSRTYDSLTKEGFTVSENRYLTLIDLMKEYVVESETARFNEVCNTLIHEFLVQASGIIERPIIYFTHNLVVLFANHIKTASTTNLQEGISYLNEHPDALIYFKELHDAFYLVIPPNRQ